MQMEIEIEEPHHFLISPNARTIFMVLQHGLTDLKYLLDNEKNEEIKNSLISNLYNVNAKIFALLDKCRNGGKNEKHYTPFRANLLRIDKILDENDNDQPRKEMIEGFLTNFWTICDCNSYCHTKLDAEICLGIYERYKAKSKREKYSDLGALLENSILQLQKISCKKVSALPRNKRLACHQDSC